MDCGSNMKIKLEDVETPLSRKNGRRCTASKPGSWHWLLAPDGSYATVGNTTRTVSTTATAATAKKEEFTEEPASCMVSKPGNWYWLLAADGSYATAGNARPAVAAATTTTAKKEEMSKEPVKSYHDTNCNSRNPHSTSRNETRDRKQSPAMEAIAPLPRVTRKRRHEAAFQGEPSASRTLRRCSTNTDNENNTVPTKITSGAVKTERKQGSWYWLLAEDGSYSTSPASIARSQRGIKPNPAESAFHLSRRETCIDDEDNEDEDGVEDDYYSDDNVPSSSYPQKRIAKWEETFQRLVRYKKKHKTTNVNTKKAGLGIWVGNQRRWYKKGKLSKERIASLESIGFEWQLLEQTDWMVMYDSLVEYKRKHKTTNANTTKAGLGRWVNRQRQLYKKGTLSKERIASLESIGFEWQLVEQTDWMEMYDRLVSYKKKHKTTNVNTTKAGLGNWVKNQRRSYKKGKLSNEKIASLESIGFEWQIHNDWMVMYDLLVAYQKKFKSTCVPQCWKEDPTLANWVHTQRQCCKAKARVDLLNKIGFVWDGRK